MNLSPGECDFDSFDAGVYECILIGDRVWLDFNENDVWDSVENGINGLRVDLFRFVEGEFMLYDQTSTGHRPGTPSDDGFYKFCVPPGRYYLRFNNPQESLVTAVPNVGVNENIDSDVTGDFGVGTTSAIDLSCGQDRCDIGAGYYKSGTIGDFAWTDINSNGLRDNGEFGIEGIVVRAINITGTVVGESVTDNNGQYLLMTLARMHTS